MRMKKAKVKFIIMLTMMILSLGITFKVMALQSPNLMLSGSENVITDNNAILHATLYNAQAEGINVKAFKWTIYKGKISNNVVVKSIEKVNTAAGNKIEIECNVNKDMGIKLEPNTEYWYQIVTIADKDLNMQLFSQSHYFTTLAEGQGPKESTSVAETSTVQITTPQETSTTKIKASKITSVKVKKAKGTSKKSVLIKFKIINGAKKYKLQYANNKKFKKAKTKVVKNNTYLIKKLKSGKAYYFRVRVNGADDNWSKWSNVKRVFIKK